MSFLLRTSTVLLVGLAGLSLHPGKLLAEDEGNCGQVEVTVHTLLGSGELIGEAPLEIAHELETLRPKLEKLHFAQFELMDKETLLIPLTKKRSLKLSKGLRLFLRPMYVEKRKVGMWIRWDDNRGRQLINTMMHFHCGENLVTATEAKKNHGFVLALEVMPKCAEPS